MNPSEITALTVAGVAFVTAVGVAIVNIITAAAAARQRQVQTDKIDETLRKTAVIEGHVNSEKTRAAGEIATLQKEVLLLRELMADKKETAALLAQSTIQTSAHKTFPAAIPVEGQSPVSVKLAEAKVLKQIEKHTKETAENTAATDVTVQEIKKTSEQ